MQNDQLIKSARALLAMYKDGVEFVGGVGNTACSLLSEAIDALEAAFAAAPAVAVKPSDIVRWIEWAGGDFLPVPPEMQVTVLLRDGSTEGPARALEFAGENSCWKHRGASGDIVAYTSDLLFASPAAQETDGWLDISGAPKDGSKVDLWAIFEKGPRRVTDAYWNSAIGNWQLGQHNADDYAVKPIIGYWRHVPAAPMPKAEGEQ
jgi:hypothetical protein